MKENEFVKFMTSFLESALEGEKLKPSKDISEKMAESFKRMESKRKESLFTDLWNKECLMDIISDEETNVKMEIHSVYYISDEDGKSVVFDISFNEYENRKYIDCDRCEFTIKFYEKDGKADFEKIFAKLYYEIEDLYKKKIVSKKAFSDFVGFNIDSFFSYKPKDKIANNTVYGAFAPSDKEVENKGNEMKDFKETIKNIFGEEVADKAIELAKKLEKEFTELKDKASDKVEEVRPKVEQAKDKAKSVFETIIDELQNKSEEVKGSFNAMKEAVKKQVEDFEIENLNTYDVEMTAIEVFVSNKVEIGYLGALSSIERFKQFVLGKTLEINGLDLNKDSEIVIEDSFFSLMLKKRLKEYALIDDDTKVGDLEFVTPISTFSVRERSYHVAKISIDNIMDVYIKFIPIYYNC